MKLLILTQYYPPEIGAPQNRLHELAVRLKGSGIDVDVLTAMPNYPKMEIQEAYKSGKIREEIIDGINIYRSSIFVSKSKSIIKRLLNYFSFVVSSYFRGRRLKNYDFLMVESPPLFLGYTAIALSKKLNAKLIFNVSDLWPESAEKLDLVTNKYLLKLAYNLEHKCYKSAALVTGQTNGIVENIQSRYPNTDAYWLPNGVDLAYYNPEIVQECGFRISNDFKEDDVLFFYGGIIGYAQGLEVILNAAKLVQKKSNIKFILQGSGPELDRLLDIKNQENISNVYFFPPVKKELMPSILKEVDVALVPLRKLELFRGAIPSKIFEALAMEIPLLLGVEGEAKTHFIDRAQAGVFFEPENEFDLAEKINILAIEASSRIEMGKNGRVYVNEYFNRNKIASDFIEKLRRVNL